MPAAKRVARPKRSTSPFVGGDVVLYQHPSGRTIVLWIVQTWGDRGGDYSTAEIVNVPAERVRLRPDAVVTAPNITGLDFDTYEGSSRSPWVELLGLERMAPDRREVLGTVPYPADRQTGPAIGTFVSPGPREQYLHDSSLDEHITRMLESRLL